jgi:predicted dehydrogenase
METLRYAVIGTAGIAGAHFAPVTSKPNVEVVGLADVNPDNLKRAAERFPQAEAMREAEVMLAKTKPDLVSVCTPNKWHREYTVMALEAGAHVICEKPMAMSLAEAREMEEARKRTDKLGYINFSYRNIDSFRFARELIRNGELGRIYRVQAVYLQSWLGSPESRFAWRNDASVAGFGALGDLGSHMIDAVRFITGIHYSSVAGVMSVNIPQKPDADGRMQDVTADTGAAFIAKMDGDVLATFETSQCAAGYGNHHRIEVSGEKGTLVVLSGEPNRIWMSLGETVSHYGTWATSLPEHIVPTMFSAAQRNDGPGLLVDAIRGEDVDYPTFADGVAAQEVLEAISESDTSGRWIEIGGQEPG